MITNIKLTRVIIFMWVRYLSLYNFIIFSVIHRAVSNFYWYYYSVGEITRYKHTNFIVLFYFLLFHLIRKLNLYDYNRNNDCDNSRRLCQKFQNASTRSGNVHSSKINFIVRNKIDNLTSTTKLLIIRVNNHYRPINQE